VNDVLADDRVTPEERAALADLANRLRLPDELARKLYRDAAGARGRARLREAIADRRFSVHEAQELGQLASSLGVQVEMDEATAWRPIIDAARAGRLTFFRVVFIPPQEIERLKG
jgi:hypothetical protein